MRTSRLILEIIYQALGNLPLQLRHFDLMNLVQKLKWHGVHIRVDKQTTARLPLGYVEPIGLRVDLPFL